MKNLLLKTLELYKRHISPLFVRSCRFTPSCSEYAGEAIKKHGAVKGSMMAVGRLLRCNPLSKGGYDPVE